MYIASDWKAKTKWRITAYINTSATGRENGKSLRRVLPAGCETKIRKAPWKRKESYRKKEIVNCMEKIIITEFDLERANPYVPIRKKEEFVENCFAKCMNRVQVSLGSEEDEAMPDMWIANEFIKSRFLMSAFVGLYLGKMNELETEDGDSWLMTESQYDLWAGSHVFGQIERLKKKASQEAQDIAYDLVRDYKDLERRMNTTLYNRIEVENDAINRLFLKLSMETSSAALEEQKKALEELQKSIEEETNKKAVESQEG